MKTFSEFNKPDIIAEKFKNFVGFTDDVVDAKSEYALQVWDMLNVAYKAIGGIKGSGFESPEAMMKKIRFWKLGFSGGELKIVVLYKDKAGRKVVALGTDGTKQGKNMLAGVLKADLDRSYKEISDGAWGFSRKYIGDEVLMKFAIPVHKVRKLLKGKEIFDLNDLPPRLTKKVNKEDPFYKFYYGREIGGSVHVKIMIGVEGLPITDKR